MERRTSASRRIANVLLSVVLVLGLMPAPAFAETGIANDAAGPAATALPTALGDAASTNDDTSSEASEVEATLTPGWTQSGTCEWMIDDEGLLTIRPLGNGMSGFLEDWGSSYNSAPWYPQRETIKTAVIEPGVSAETCKDMFEGCSSLSSLDPSGLDTSNVTYMRDMFYGCSSLAELDLSSFDTSNVTYMRDMFYGCSSLSTVYASTGFDVSAVTTSTDMFSGCSVLSGGNGTVYSPDYTDKYRARVDDYNSPGYFTMKGQTLGWKVCGTCEWKIDGDGLLTVRPLGGGASGELADWSSIYGGYAPWHPRSDSIKSAVIEPGVSARTCHFMFSGCSSLSSLDLSGLDTSNVTDMGGMFEVCSKLASLDLSGFDTSQVTSMDDIFSGCSSLSFLDLSSFDTSQVTRMSGMFDCCSNLSSLDLSGFDTSQVTSMYWMFCGCKSLAELDLSSFDTSKVTDMGSMFDGCSSLSTVYASTGFDVSAVTSSEDMFSGCTSLVGGKGTAYDSSFIDASRARIDGGVNAPGYFTAELTPEMTLTPGWTQSGTCEWRIDEDGLLTVRPLGDGEPGTLANWGSNPEGAPWYSQRKSIVTAVIEPGVSTKTCTGMFRGCSSLASLDMSSFDTSKVTSMGYMFYGCSSLASLDLSGLDTSNVTSMCYMFDACSSLATLDLSSFDTSAVTNMGYMFCNCSSLATIYASPGFDASAVASFEDMFRGCERLVGGSGTAYDSGYTDKQRARIDALGAPGYFTDKNAMGAAVLYSDGALVFQADASPMQGHGDAVSSYKFNLSGVYNETTPWAAASSRATSASFAFPLAPQSMRCWFSGFSKLEFIDFANLDTSAVTDMSGMFKDCSSLAELDLRAFDTSSVTAMGYCDYYGYKSRGMFEGCGSLKVLDLSSFDTSAVTDMRYMFDGCSSLTSLDLSSFDTSAVTNMRYMFFGCSSLTTLDLSGFDTSKVTDMGNMFSFCSLFSSLDLSGFDTSKTTSMLGMFYDCSSLASLDLTGFDTSAVTNMSVMFSGCSSLTTLDLTGFDTSAVTDMGSMFSGCSSLTSLDLSSFSFEKVTEINNFAPNGKPMTVRDAESYRILASKASMHNITVKDIASSDETWSVWNTCEWKVENGTLVIRPAGGAASGMLGYPFQQSDMYVNGVYVYYYAPWCQQVEDIKSVTIEPGIIACDSVANLFSNHTNLASANLSGLDFSTVKDMSQMFYGCASLKEIPTGFEMYANIPASRCFYVPNSTEMRYTGTDSAITTYDWASDNRVLGPAAAEGWDRFGGVQWQVADGALTISPLPGETGGEMGSLGVYAGAPWYAQRKDIASVKIEGDIKAGASLGYAFDGMANLVSADLSNLDVSATADMSCMFRGCSSLAAVDLSGWAASSLENAYAAFSKCASLQSANLIGWDFSRMVDMRQMFAYCPMLISVPLGLTIPDGANAAKLFYVESDEPVSIRYGGDDGSVRGYDWASDNRELSAGCAGEHSWDEGTVTKEPTCTEPGEKTLTCTACGATLVGSYIAPTGHAWGEPVIVFSEDGKSAVASWTCNNDASHTETADCNVTSEATKAATCTEAGETTYTATAASEGMPSGTAQKTLADVPAKGHRFESYASDGNATCEADGTETAACANGCGATDTRIAKGSALGHDWLAPAIAFSEDGKSAYAIWACANDASHMKVSACDVTSSVSPVTCEDAETTTYTATVSADGMPSGTSSTTRATAPAKGHAWGEWQVEAAATCEAAGTERRTCANDGSHAEERAIPATGHAWGEPAVEFSDDMASATATWTCANDSKHAVTRDCVVTSSVSKPATCTEAGETTYAATIDADLQLGLANGRASMVVADIPALGHDMVKDEAVPPTCDKPGIQAGSHCSRCDYSVGHGAIEPLGHAWGAWEVATAATCGAPGMEHRICENDPTHIETRSTEALPHTWGEPAIVFSEDGKSATAIWTCKNDASHMKVSACAVTSSVAPATCEDAETTTYTATVIADGMPFGTSFTTRVTAPAKGHAWGEWQVEAAATCEAAGTERRTCANDGSHAEERAIPATGHAWGEPAVEFSDDMASATATWTCANDASHRHVESCKVTKREKLAASCFAHGEDVYVATAAFAGAAPFVFEAASENTLAKGHRFEGMVCADCGTHLGDVNGNGAVNIVDAQIAYDIAAHNEYSGIEAYAAYCKAADVTGAGGAPDGAVDAVDAFRIQYIIHYGWGLD